MKNKHKEKLNKSIDTILDDIIKETRHELRFQLIQQLEVLTRSVERIEFIEHFKLNRYVCIYLIAMNFFSSKKS